MKQITDFIGGYEDQEIMKNSETLPKREQSNLLKGGQSLRNKI